jgi:glutamine amidotransferase
MSSKICIIDYKSGGNLFSVMNSFEYIGVDTYISDNPAEILKAEKIFFPGVGSFAKAIENLNNLKLTDIIKTKIQSGTPFLGVCLGMQVLFD